MREFNKQDNTLYFGLPSGGLRERILDVFTKIGWPIAAGEKEYQFPSYEDPNLGCRKESKVHDSGKLLQKRYGEDCKNHAQSGHCKCNTNVRKQYC